MQISVSTSRCHDRMAVCFWAMRLWLGAMGRGAIRCGERPGLQAGFQSHARATQEPCDIYLLRELRPSEGSSCRLGHGNIVSCSCKRMQRERGRLVDEERTPPSLRLMLPDPRASDNSDNKVSRHSHSHAERCECVYRADTFTCQPTAGRPSSAGPPSASPGTAPLAA